MKKSEKEKGKEAAANRRKQYTTYGIIIALVVVVVGLIGYFALVGHVTAKVGDTVGVYYTGTLDNGTVFDSNVNDTPLQFTLGSGQMIPGFDKAVVGMAVGESKTVRIPVDQAYGPYHPDLVATYKLANLSLATPPVVGDRLKATNPTTGATTTMRVINVTPSTVTVDANFDLAGENLTFSIRLASIAQK